METTIVHWNNIGIMYSKPCSIYVVIRVPQDSDSSQGSASLTAPATVWPGAFKCLPG